MKKDKKEKKQNSENKIKFSEKLSLKFRKRVLTSRVETFFIVAILVMAYIALNLWASKTELPQIDVTENQLYTITESTKKVIENISQEVKIYAYGFEEDSSLIDLLKQYNEVNDKITAEILTEENNYEMVTKYGLSEGYNVVIIQSGGSEKVIDASTEFTTYDYTTYQSVDITEQTITNTILALNTENKPKIYFTQGHQEYDSTAIGSLVAKLKNEAFEVEFVNLATKGMVPEDCDILAIISPSEDFHDVEVAAVNDYINKGGEIFFSMDVISQAINLSNLQKILDLYGVSFENGYVFECSDNKYLSEYNYIFMPEISNQSDITKDIYTDSALWLVFSGRLKFQSDEMLQNLNITKETLLSSTDESLFITNLSTDLSQAVSEATAAGTFDSSEIASAITKKIIKEDGSEVESKLVMVASSSFMADYVLSELNQSYPLSYIGSNLDFVLNSMGQLGGKENILTIRKEYNSSTYTPTNIQNIIVIAIIILVPLFIIIIGLVVGVWRKRRK